MSQNSLTGFNQKQLNKLRQNYDQNREAIIDIILFGSAARGKEKVHDIDIIVVFNQKVNFDLVHAIRDILKEEQNRPIHISGITYAELLSPSYQARPGVLMEGISLISGKALAEGYGLKSYHLFITSVSRFSKSNKMRFYYALNGRLNQKGILLQYNGSKISDNLILIPTRYAEPFRAFLERWNVLKGESPILLSTDVKFIFKKG